MQTSHDAARRGSAPNAKSTPAIPARIQTAFVNELCTARLVSAADAATAVRHANQTGVSIVDGVVALGLVTERASYQALAAAAGTPFAHAKTVTPSALAVKLVPDRIARRHNLVPIAVDDRTITYITAHLFDAEAERDVCFTSGRRAVAMLACRSDVQALLDRAYPHDVDVQTLLARLKSSSCVEHVDALADAPSDSAVIGLCNSLLARAVEMGASDLHLDPSSEATIVRMRIAGVLETALSLPPDAAALVRNRFKVIARADITVRHRPQDGAFAVRVNGRRIDVRLSSVPTTSGEKLALRIIDSQSQLQSLDALGYDDETLARLRRALDRPDGLVLVTGPTGSGKTTALYSALGYLRNGRVNIVSVEDPVERTLAGVNQIPVDARSGNSFASVLRSVLRQDPDVVMVGEVRDAEVATMVGQAAFTGHLVLSSVHTTDAASAILRLLNLGLEPFKVAECLSAILAQRLLRRLCPSCRVTHSDFESRRLGNEHGVPRIAASEGPGCERCKFTGYVDRVPVAELLTPNDEIRQVIGRGATAGELRAAMRNAGMPTMRDRGVALLAEGTTSIDEITRVLGVDDAAPAPATPSSAKRVLIAEDDAITRMLVRVLLERDGYTVIEALTGDAAVQLARRERPELIVMDLNMPQMDGYEAIRDIRRTPALAHVPIVVVTAEEGTDVERRVLDLGADDYIVKPFEPAVLGTRVAAVFRRRQVAAA